MKKLSKILVLLLSLIAIVTAFTVVALADEATEKDRVVVLQYDAENHEAGKIINDSSDASGEKFGIWLVGESDNQKNNYLIGEYKAGDKNQQNLDISFGATWSMNSYFGKETVDTKPYGSDEYSVFAFDFDIMSPTGSFDGNYSDGSLTFRYYGVKDSTDTGRIFTIEAGAFKNFGLSTVPYEWQHVTVILSHEGNGLFKKHIFVNGIEKSVTEHSNSSTYSEYTNVRVNYVVLYPVLDSSGAETKLCMDNLEISYYKGYSVAEAAANVYTNEYKLPYGKTVASIVEGEVETKYDNIKEAYAAANKNNVLKLYADATCEINKAMTVDAGEFAFNWTSDTYVDVNEDEKIFEFSSVEDYYDGKFTDQSGNVTYFKGYKEFEDIVQSVIDNAVWDNRGKMNTIVLYNDLEYYKSFSFNKRYEYLTIDLKGNTLTHVKLYGDVYTRDTVDDAYVQGAATTLPSHRSAFYLASQNDQTIIIKSSTEKGTFRAISAQGTAYYTNGKIDSYTATSLKGAGVIASTGNIGSINLEFNNVNVFSEYLVNGTWAGGNGYNVTVENSGFYKTVGDGSTTADGGKYCIALENKNSPTITLTNSVFYFPSSSVIGSNNDNVEFLKFGGANANHLSSAVITNCDIISENASVCLVAGVAEQASFVFNNCRIWGIINETQGCTTLGANTVISSSIITGSSTPTDCTLIDKSQSIVYNLPKNSAVSFDAEKGLVFDFDFQETPITFDKRVVLKSDTVDVYWLDTNGDIVATTQDIKGDIATPPENVKIPTGNGYTAFTNPVWKNANGGTDLVVGENTSFKAYAPSEPVYVAHVTEAMFSMAYFDMIRYYLYVPVVEGVEILQLGSYGPGESNFGVVSINGEKYWCSVASWHSVKNTISNFTSYIQFKAHGQEFVREDTNGDGKADSKGTAAAVNLSAIIYADSLFATPGVSQIEKDAILDMLAYVEQVYRSTSTGAVVPDSAKTIFNNFFAKYYNSDDPTARPAYDEIAQEVYDIDPTFDKYVSSIQFALHDSGRLSLGVTLDKGTYDPENPDVLLEDYLNYKATSNLTGSGYKTNGLVRKEIGEDGKEHVVEVYSYTYYNKNSGFRELLMDNYEIVIKDANGNPVATQDYNLATYAATINTDEARDLVSSIYTLGKSVEAVREYLSNNSIS